MSFLKRLFGGTDKPKGNYSSGTDTEGTKISKLHYLMNYRRHYSELLNLNSAAKNQEKIISELFLFRQWIIQLLYRVFTNAQTGENVIQSILNEGDSLGKGILKQVDQVDIEKTLGKSYMDLVNDRWTQYDNVFIAHKSSTQLPYKEILDELLKVLKLKDVPIDGVMAQAFLSADLIDLQKQAKGLISEYHYGGKMTL